ncbi:C40 family peptidase [Hymenobacter persicinus]|uniref:NlpC/P60 family protein n=1 Tax=Hymenobacter persicinus TaxID=2025506 RepID=A0A4Q5LB18_9BACT|nr:C40 family peptidase [Hymenobacter persicinus]RYU76060.1 NlpC/P60 family protein [Hymenobacter persicinus]
MRDHRTKVQHSRQWRHWLPLLALVLLAGLAGCGGSRKLNQRNGRYYSARDMARMKAADRRRGVVSKTKSKAPAGKAKLVVKRKSSPATVRQDLATVIQTARSFQGTPYKYGGTSRLGMDCSGLLFNSFAAINVQIPRSSNEQAVWGTPVKPQDLQAGDLVFFGASPGSSTITHVGLVTEASPENVQFIHSSSSLGVVENSLESDYYLSRFIKAVRPVL